MNSLDIIMACIIGFYLIRGLFRGFIKEFFSIIGVFIGFFLAFTYYDTLEKYLSGWITHPNYLPLLSFFTIFLSVYILISLLGVVIKYLLRITILGWVDRLFGVVFGAGKGALIGSILLLVLITFLPNGSPFLSGSRLSPYLLPAVEKMALVVPKPMKHQFAGNAKTLKKAWRISVL